MTERQVATAAPPRSGLVARATSIVAAQAQHPTGVVGRIVSWCMPLGFTTIDPAIARLLRLQPDDRYLDVACGAGAFLRRHADHVAAVAGLDASELQIGRARRRHRRRLAAGTAALRVGDAAALPWEDGTFTAVSCNSVDCFTAPDRSLAEMRRVLAPGGRVVVALQRSERSDDDPGPDLDTWGMPRHTAAEARALLDAAGFDEVLVTGDRQCWYVRGHRR
jgi:SAM-dependent methyltransferase